MLLVASKLGISSFGGPAAHIGYFRREYVERRRWLDERTFASYAVADGAIFLLGLAPDEFVLWNAFPWHSFKLSSGMLSNRMPTQAERSAGRPVLMAFLDLFPCQQVVALGRVAAAALEDVLVPASCLRHPASGGARLFREQIVKIVAKLTS